MIHRDHASTITRAADGTPATARQEFELVLLSRAKDQTRPQLAAKARRLREKLHPDALGIWDRDAVAECFLALESTQDGVANLTAYLLAAAATAGYNRTTAGMRTRAGTQIKADVLVTIPMLTLLGRSQVARELDGYGPIPAAMARDLAAGSATLIGLFT